jgi:excisionase family DNA binding protein
MPSKTLAAPARAAFPALDPARGSLPDQEFWSPQQLAKLLGVSRRTVWSMVARGDLPRPLRVSRSLVRWTRSDVAAFIERLEARRTA